MVDMNELAQPRETGSEKSGFTCKLCGAQLPAVTSIYGSVSPGACPSCWPAVAPTQLAAQKAAADEPVEPAPAPAIDGGSVSA